MVVGHMHRLSKVLGLAVILAATGQSPLFAQNKESAADLQRRLLQDAVTHPGDQAKVDALINSLVEIPKGSGQYIVEGDIALSKDEIVSYLRDFGTPPPIKVEELIVNAVNGQADYLKTAQQRKLTYAMAPETFPNQGSADRTKANFVKAAADWVNACPECGVSFTEVAPRDAYFVIKYVNFSDGTVAKSFFPSSAANERVLNVYTPYLSPDLQFDSVGVLRHEIGHILGYRHEHIQNIPGCYMEGTDWLPVTPYTPNSVMHYFCGGRGSLDLALRDSDKQGHRCLYTTGKACPPTK
jgi:hypothetical protein